MEVDASRSRANNINFPARSFFAERFINSFRSPLYQNKFYVDYVHGNILRVIYLNVLER